MNFVKFLRIGFLHNISRRLLLCNKLSGAKNLECSSPRIFMTQNNRDPEDSKYFLGHYK